MLQFCGLDSSHIDYIVDDAPAKHGFLTPGSHIPIVPNSSLGNPDMLIVFAWSFLSEIQDRCSGYKGELIIPLPDIYRSEQREAA